jgi:pyruvate formate lyase activating enzyme
VTVEAAYWRAETGGQVVCLLCPVGCVLANGKDGPCGSRGNREGRMVARRYGEVAAAGLDPM